MGIDTFAHLVYWLPKPCNNIQVKYVYLHLWPTLPYADDVAAAQAKVDACRDPTQIWLICFSASMHHARIHLDKSTATETAF